MLSSNYVRNYIKSYQSYMESILKDLESEYIVSISLLGLNWFEESFSLEIPKINELQRAYLKVSIEIILDLLEFFLMRDKRGCFNQFSQEDYEQNITLQLNILEEKIKNILVVIPFFETDLAKYSANNSNIEK